MIQVNNYSAGKFVVQEGKVNDRIYFIISGSVEVVKVCEDGGYRLLTTMGEGDTFGEWSLMAPPHLTSVSVKVTQPAQVLVLSREDFDKFAQEEPTIALKVIYGVIGSVWTSIREVEGILKECL